MVGTLKDIFAGQKLEELTALSRKRVLFAGKGKLMWLMRPSPVIIGLRRARVG
jgi:hypothetical protein